MVHPVVEARIAVRSQAEHVPLVKSCDWEKMPSGLLQCKQCGIIYPYPVNEEKKTWPYNVCKTKGPGDYLHDAILKWVGEGPTRKCGCRDRINQMNTWGPEQCREHIEEIVDWLMAEAAKRGWWKVATIIPCSRFAVKRLLILPAIEKAESKD